MYIYRMWRWQASRQVGRWSCMHAGRKAGRKAGIWAGGQVGMQAGRRADRQTN